MRRSICYCEPNQLLAGETNTWKFVYTTATALPKGTKLRFDMLIKDRNIDWEKPTTDLKKGANAIYAVLDSGKAIQAKEIASDTSSAVFDFILPAAVPAGGNVMIVVGSTKETTAKKNGNKAQTNAQRRRSFNLLIDTTGKNNFQEPEVFTLDIRGNTMSTIRILTPSFVVRNKRFDVIVRFEDEFGNLTSQAPEDTLIELSHEHLRENLNWKLFVPETGFIALPNLYFNEPGIYTIQLRNSKTKEIFKSSPIKCFAENNKNLFWGLLHGESERFDATDNIESCLRHFRDDKAFNFSATSPFESAEETSNDIWKLIAQNVSDFDEADRFTAFLGFQWAGVPGEEGLRHMFYTKDNKTLQRKKDPKYSSLKKIYKLFSPKELISIPSFTMGKGLDFNFKDYNPDFERLVEIYNSWGSSECSKKDGNPIPISATEKKGIQETPEGSIQKALLKNCRFGFVAGGLDDRGVYGPLFENGQEQYPPGMTAIISAEHTRSAIADALFNRSCYATTGERIILGLYLAGASMGKELNSGEKPGLIVNRHLSGYVAGTTTLASVEVIRNGKVIHSFECNGYTLDFTYDDMTPLDKVALDAKDKKPPFVYYYIRVTQEDGHMAWSSPIWVDFVKPIPVPKVPAKKPTKPAPPPAQVFDEEDDEDEELDYDVEDDEDED